MKENKRPGQQLKGLSVQELLGVTNVRKPEELLNIVNAAFGQQEEAKNSPNS